MCRVSVSVREEQVICLARISSPSFFMRTTVSESTVLINYAKKVTNSYSVGNLLQFGLHRIIVTDSKI